VRLSTGRYHSFVVRLWSRDGGPAAWRGQITHVATHRTLRFTDLPHMVAFMQSHLVQSVGDLPDDPPGEAPGETPGETRKDGR
jgi:hypothetical protein